MTRTRIGAAVASVWLALPFCAVAVDGVLEINQTCAVKSGCFSNDAPGFPVTIDGTAGRSYRLTSNLVVPQATSGITVGSPSTTIDLNGFEIARSGCQGATSNCTPSAGPGTGVIRSNSSIPGISVKNGTISGMGDDGLLLGVQAHVTNLQVRWNRVDGISVREGSLVTGNVVLENGDDGIFVRAGSTVSGNSLFGNGGSGVVAGSGSGVQRNTSKFNGGYGLDLAADAAYTGNSVNNNTTGTVNGGVNAGANSCNATTTCP